MREQFTDLIRSLQNQICAAIEAVDGKQKFIEDRWERADGGGGITRVIANGNVFEKGGVNTSTVHGTVTDAIRTQLKIEGDSFFACGISLVIHPTSPMVPTVHANWRYFELYDKDGMVTDCWFGGGADLTPYVLFEQDAKHFHQCFKDSCDQFDASFYPKYKLQCDNYFVNHHRNGERRGIGGIFYDYLRPNESMTAQALHDFAKAHGEAFIKAYIPIAERTRDLPFNEQQKHWQLIRRGRYVEFNLIHDRGTIFGLKSNGRTESILMSLPQEVRFEYNYQPQGAEELALQEVLLNPKEWV